METAKFNQPKFDPSKKGPGIIQSVISGVDSLISSSEENKMDLSNVGHGAPTNAHTPESTYLPGNMDKLKTTDQIVKEEKKANAVTRFNDAIRGLGDSAKEWMKSEGKNLASNAIANAAQPGPAVQSQPVFGGATISSTEANKEDAPEIDKETVESNGGIIPMMAQIDSYLYKYKPEAQEEYAGTGMMNDDTNLGVIAEQMNENPLTKPAVTTDEKGNLALDGGRLSSINTAVISELCRKVMELESVVYGRG